MKRNLGFCIGLVICLTLASPLTKVTPVRAADIWQGSSSFSIKATTMNDDDPQNIKFVSLTIPMAGTVQLHIDGGNLVTDEEGGGCYIKFSNKDGTTICFKDIVVISTEVKKSKTDQLLLIGTGDFDINVMGISLSGIIYLDTKGTIKKDSSGNIVSIGLSGKIGGGSQEGAVFSSTINTTLTKGQ